MQKSESLAVLGEPVDFPYMNEILVFSVVLVIIRVIIVWCLLARETEKGRVRNDEN